LNHPIRSSSGAGMAILSEMNNLAVKAKKHKDVILHLNGLLNDLMSHEVGVNDGSFLPKAVRPKGPIRFK
jgi:hypothetical protein